MSEAEDREDVTAAAEEETAGSSGGSLFKRAFSGEPQDSGVRAWLFASGGALVALAVAGLGVRKWRHRRG